MSSKKVYLHISPTLYAVYIGASPDFSPNRARHAGVFSSRKVARDEVKYLKAHNHEHVCIVAYKRA
jgi:hypothetical protein